MNISEILKPIENELKACEEFSRQILDSKVRLVLSAGNYILDSGGKRIRPALTILSGKLLGADNERLIPVATVMEYMHTATLLHDDIVDGAKLRRGRKSANEVFGNDVAVLVGDYMFAKAIYVLAHYGGEEVLKVAARSVQEMSEGELKQLELIGNIDVTKEDYFDVIYRKTASLLSACCECGAIVAGANEDERKALRDFGKYLGMAFQLVDDAFDYVESDDQIGKPAGNDIREGKVTYPLISVLAKCSEKEIVFIRDVFNGLGRDSNDVEEVKNLVKKYGGVNETLRLADEYIGRSLRYVENMSGNVYLSSLKKLAEFFVEREF